MIQICPQCRAEYRDEAKFCINDGTRLVTKGTSSDPLVGTLIGDRYILERQLGRGSHGFVYRATHNEIPRAYAIKFLRPSFGGHLAPAKLERFRREAFSLASLRHPAVVQVTDYGVHSELGPYLVMDLLQGHGLDKYLKMHAPLRPLDLFELVSQLASALAAAHEQGIVHRDLKSENVMILSSTYTTKVLRVCILDFGVVKLLESDGEEHIPAARATVIGTPYTMAPEQITGQAIDCRADIYALGVLLYEAVTRELPFVGQEAWEQIESHLHDFPDPPSKRSKVGGWVPPSLDRFLLSMLAKDPAHRPASMAEVQEIFDGLRPEIVNAWANYKLVATPTSLPKPKPKREGHVLLVEDEPGLRRLIRQLLTREGYQVTALERGDEVLPWLRDNPPPFAIVLDIMLPGLDGISVLRGIRKRYTNLNTIICSSIESESVHVEARDLGAFATLDKHNELHILPELLLQLEPA